MKREQRNLSKSKLLRGLGIIMLFTGILIVACQRPESPKIVQQEKSSSVIVYPDTTVALKMTNYVRIALEDSLQQTNIYRIYFRKVIETRTRKDSCIYLEAHRYGKVVISLVKETSQDSIKITLQTNPCFREINGYVSLPLENKTCVNGVHMIAVPFDTLGYSFCVPLLLPQPDSVNQGNIPDSAYTLYLTIYKK